jgi:hypothetical protein
MDGKELPEVLQTLFNKDAERLADECECFERKRLLNGPSLAKTLVFGFLHDPNATSNVLAQTAAALGVSISPQGIEARLDEASIAEFLRALVEEAVKKAVVVPATLSERLQRFTAVELLDSTSVMLPDAMATIWSGCGTNSPQGGKAAMKIQTRFDLLKGTLCLDLTHGRACDQNAAMQTADLQAGALHVRDLGYFNLDVLQAIDAAVAFFLMRLMSGTAVYDLDGNRLDLIALLRDRVKDLDMWVLVGATAKLKVRLLARRLPSEVASRRRQRLRKKAKDQGYQPTAEALELRGWTIAVTNAPTDKLTMNDALALMRQRWQIELLFKLWKSRGRLGHSNRELPQRILAETYAKLLAMVVQHWALWLALGQYVDRSLVKGSTVVRGMAWQLLMNLQSLGRLCTLFDTLRKILQKTARVQKRAKKPAAFQVLADPTTYGYKRA